MGQTELGKHVGLSVQQIQNYEKGMNRIAASRLWVFSLVLGRPISWFFEQCCPAEFGAATADIEDQGMGHLGIEQLHTAMDGQARLLVGRDDLQLETGGAKDPGKKGIAVSRPPASFGGDRADPGDAIPAHLTGAYLERLEGSRHGGLGQAPAPTHTLAKPHDSGEGVDDLKAPSRSLGDQEPAIVGAQIQRRIDLGRGLGVGAGPARALALGLGKDRQAQLPVFLWPTF